MDAEDREALARLNVQVPAEPKKVAARERMGPELARHLHGAFRLCDAMCTQIRAVAGPAGMLVLGFDYAPRLDLCRTLGLPTRGEAGRRLLKHLQVMEDEFVAARNERAAGASA